MSRWYVSAKRTEALFQYVEGPDDPTQACAEALAHPGGWTTNHLEGHPRWEAFAREAPEPSGLGIGMTRVDLIGGTGGPTSPPAPVSARNLLDDQHLGDDHTEEDYARAAYREYAHEKHTAPRAWSELYVTDRRGWRAAVRQVLAMKINQDLRDQPRSPGARYDLIAIPGHDFSLGLSKDAPIGVKLVVICDDEQFVITKNIDHVVITELGATP